MAANLWPFGPLPLTQDHDQKERHRSAHVVWHLLRVLMEVEPRINGVEHHADAVGERGGKLVRGNDVCMG